MSRLLLPPWHSQPQYAAPLDRSARINRDLAFFAPFGPSDGYRDLVTGRAGTPTGLGTRGATRLGQYPVFGSSDYASFAQPDGISGTTPITIAWTQQPTSVANAYPNILSWKPTGATNKFTILISATGGYYCCAGPQDGASTTATWDSATGPSVVGRLNNFCLQIKAGTDSGDRTTFEMFRDGVKLAREGFPTSFISESISEFIIGKRSAGDGFQGYIGNFHIWRRVLADQEAAEWTRNPFITRAPRERRLYVLGGAGGTNGTGGGATYLAASTFVAGGATGVRNASAGGATWLAAATWLGGGGTAGVNGTGGGATWLAAASFIAGGATGVRNATTGGATWLAASSYLAGGAVGTAFAGGATWLAASSFIGGGASAVRNASAGGTTWVASATWLNGGAFGNTPSDLQRWRWIGLPISMGL